VRGYDGHRLRTAIAADRESGGDIRGRVATIAPVHPELAWLADSISLVISAGVEVDSVGLTTNLGGGPFYAVALQRAITLTGLNSSATFDAIFFNDPSNPTDFLIVDGWKQNNSAAIPTSVSGSFNNPQTTQTLNAHFFHVNGTTVTAWRGTAGTATLTSGTTSTNSCLNITALGSATCSTTALTTAFTISTALADNGSALDTKNATLSTTDLPGIRLTFHF
jgi:hypothetical protein